MSNLFDIACNFSSDRFDKDLDAVIERAKIIKDKGTNRSQFEKNLVKNLKPSSTLVINETSRKLEEQGKKIFKFGFGQSPFRVPQDIVEELKNNGQFIKITNAGMNESHVHDVSVSKEAPNYPRR